MSTNNLACFFERKFVLLDFSIELRSKNSLCLLILPSIPGSNIMKREQNNVSNENLVVTSRVSLFTFPSPIPLLCTSNVQLWLWFMFAKRNFQWVPYNVEIVEAEMDKQEIFVQNWDRQNVWRQTDNLDRSVNILTSPTPLKDCRAIYTVHIKAVDGL